MSSWKALTGSSTLVESVSLLLLFLDSSSALTMDSGTFGGVDSTEDDSESELLMTVEADDGAAAAFFLVNNDS